MTKKGFRRAVLFILAMLLCASVAINFKLFDSLKTEQNKTANSNQNNWSQIRLMAVKIENLVDSPDKIKDYVLYQNTVLYSANFLSPSFGTEETLKSYFLTTVYDPFVQDLACLEEGEALTEGYNLYKEMNNELEIISRKVLEGEAEDLLNEKSDAYKDIKQQIEQYCDRYYDAINDYNRKYNP